MELLEVQLTTADGQTGVLELESTPDNNFTLHALANLGIFEVAVREQGSLVWSVIDSGLTPCDKCQTLIDSDTHAEELGMCLSCSNAYFDEADN